MAGQARTPNSFLVPAAVENVPPITKSITVAGVAGNAATLTIPAPSVANQFNYVTSLTVMRVNDSAADVTGSAALNVTSTNFNSFQLLVGNALAAGAQVTDYMLDHPNPVKSNTAGTATTFVGPAPGTGIRWTISATYYQGE